MIYSHAVIIDAMTDVSRLEFNGIASGELTADPRFAIVVDKVPLVSSWGLSEIKPRPGLTEAAVVQRTAQLYSPYYRFQTSEGGRIQDLHLESMGIGLEDKLTKPAEGMAKFFAGEGANLKHALALKFPGHTKAFEALTKDWQIQDPGNEVGRLQLLMLVEMDKSVASLVSRLNRQPYRQRGHLSYDFRQSIYDLIRNSDVKENNLIKYRNGERLLAIPKKEELVRVSGSRFVEGYHNLGDELSRLSWQELKDWELLRAAVFNTSDPRIREVLEANREIKIGMDVPQKDVNNEVLIEIERVATERAKRATGKR